jgi:hypothetical protein
LSSGGYYEKKGEEKIYKEMGMNVEVYDSGCCGKAGYSGYKKVN